MRQLQLQCAVDNEVTPHNQPTPNHLVHALVSLFLLGLWIPVWIIVAVTSGNESATCVKCGNKRPPNGAAVVTPKVEVKATSSKQIAIMFAFITVVIIALTIVDAVTKS